MLGGSGNAMGQRVHVFRMVQTKNCSIRQLKDGLPGPPSLQPLHLAPQTSIPRYLPAPGSGLRSNNSSRRLLVGESRFMLFSLDTSLSLLLLSYYLLSESILPGAPGESETGEDAVLIL